MRLLQVGITRAYLRRSKYRNAMPAIYGPSVLIYSKSASLDVLHRVTSKHAEVLEVTLIKSALRCTTTTQSIEFMFIFYFFCVCVFVCVFSRQLQSQRARCSTQT